MLNKILTHEEQILILDALALAIDACEWTNGEKAEGFMHVYQTIAPHILIDEDDEHYDANFIYQGD